MKTIEYIAYTDYTIAARNILSHLKSVPTYTRFILDLMFFEIKFIYLLQNNRNTFKYFASPKLHK